MRRECLPKVSRRVCVLLKGGRFIARREKGVWREVDVQYCSGGGEMEGKEGKGALSRISW